MASSFTYIAIDAQNQKINGTIAATDRGEALKQLDRKGLRPLKLEQQKESKGAAEKGTAKSTKQGARAKSSKAKKQVEPTAGQIKLKKSEVILFTEELSDMLSAGLQLEPALRSMGNRQQAGNLQQVSERVRDLVRDGTSFSKSLNQVSPSFGPLYTNMAAAGEASGALDTILLRQAHYLKTIGDLQNKVILALIYPAFLVVAGLGVSAIFITTLIPQLSTLLESVPGATMPRGAVMMLATTDFMAKWWWVILLVILVLALAFKGWKDIEANKPIWDQKKLDIPLIGAVTRDRFYVQFLETMANLAGNGLTLLRSLELTRNATQNLHFKEELSEVIDLVGDGRSLSNSLKRSGEFPDLLIDMVIVGEQTGQIDKALAKAAIRYDKELNNSLQRIMALLMPTVLIMISILVGMMVYLLLTAIFQTVGSLGG